VAAHPARLPLLVPVVMPADPARVLTLPLPHPLPIEIEIGTAATAVIESNRRCLEELQEREEAFAFAFLSLLILFLPDILHKQVLSPPFPKM
jgi:hypothetical protein